MIIYERLQGLILLFKIPTDMRKNFFEICRQFGHAASESTASPVLDEVFCQLPSLLLGETQWQPIAYVFL